MAVKEAVHVRQFAAGHVPITALIFAAVEALLLLHKRIRIFLVLLANARMIGQELLQIAGGSAQLSCRLPAMDPCAVAPQFPDGCP